MEQRSLCFCRVKVFHKRLVKLILLNLTKSIPNVVYPSFNVHIVKNYLGNSTGWWTWPQNLSLFFLLKFIWNYQCIRNADCFDFHLKILCPCRIWTVHRLNETCATFFRLTEYYDFFLNIFNWGVKNIMSHQIKQWN